MKGQVGEKPHKWKLSSSSQLF